ncbi:hypothetical protein [Synechococcus sp. KORDI-100]|uniref:hypothetical protein n=1 Tax=Synechococcus sp. KORDI-100 TaxID=1280380 RepID=UPI0012E0B06D|nr:hypothetical protein [Synechococcus sp. KORDI-100]
MKLPFVLGALILSVAQVMVSAEPVEVLVNEEEHHEYCWSNRNCAMRIIGMNSLSWGFGSNLSNTAKHNLKAG